MDMDAYDAELEAQKKDAIGIMAAKKLVLDFMKTIELGDTA